MRNLIAPLLLSAFTALPVASSAADRLPPGDPPTIALAHFANEALHLTERKLRYVTESYTAELPVTRVVNGKPITETVTEVRSRKRPIQESVTHLLTPEEATLYDVAGQTIPVDDWNILLKTQRFVLVTTDNRPLAAAYRELYRDDVLVVAKKPRPEPQQTRLKPAPKLRPPGIRGPIRVRAVPVQIQLRAVPARAVPVQKAEPVPAREPPPLPEGR